MSDEKATVTTPAQNGNEPERTFTQAEMDAIIGDRLKRERAKYADYDDLKSKATAYDAAKDAEKSELEKATDRANSLQAELDAIKKANQERELRERIARETGVPVDALRGETEEDLRAQADAIVGFVKSTSPAYPKVKDGGEVNPPSVSKNDILAIKNERERLKAIRENIELFK